MEAEDAIAPNYFLVIEGSQYERIDESCIPWIVATYSPFFVKAKVFSNIIASRGLLGDDLQKI